MPPRPFASVLCSLPTRAAAASRILGTRSAYHSQRSSTLPVIYRTMATQATPNGTGNTPSFSSLGIKHTDIKCAPGVELNEQQKVIVGSVLDLFEGHPTLKHFSLWSQNATFADNITVAQGYNKYTSQFYGLPALFNPIQLQRHTVVNAGNPIEIEMSNKYVVKGIKKEQIMDSLVRIHVGSDGKIEKVEDKWNGKLPDGAISEAFRKLNGVTVPAFVKVPKTDEEDLKMKADRESS